MIIHLTPGDWIDKPVKSLSDMVTRCDIRARLNIEDAEIIGNGHQSCGFEVQR